MVDGASNDEGWGCHTIIAAVRIGAVQEMRIHTNAFSAEYGWTSGPAINIVTKSGTNDSAAKALYIFRPAGTASKDILTDGYCPPSDLYLS